MTSAPPIPVADVLDRLGRGAGHLSELVPCRYGAIKGEPYGSRQSRQVFSSVERGVKRLPARLATRTVRALIHDPDRTVRAFGLQLAEDIASKGLVPDLVEVCRSERSELLRGDAARALGRIGDKRAVRGIISVLAVREWSARCDAVESLGYLGDARAIPPLRRLLRTKNEVLKGYVMTSLAQLGDESSIPFLRRCLRGKSGQLRLEAAVSLVILGEESGLSVIRECQRSKDKDLRFIATMELKWVRALMK